MFRAIPGLFFCDISAKYQYRTPHILIIYERYWNASLTNANGFSLFPSNDLSAISIYNYFYLLNISIIWAFNSSCVSANGFVPELNISLTSSYEYLS